MSFFIYLLACALVTYLIRMLPLVLVKEKIKNRFLISFLYYVPYTVLSVMTIPAIFYATDNIISAAAALVSAFVSAYRGRSLVTVAVISCMTVLVFEFLIRCF